MPDRHIFLIGMQGCGKSSLGKRVARETGIPFADTDAIVARSAGGTVNDFYAQYGEEKFRQAETGALVLLTRARPMIISTGGSTVMNPENRQTSFPTSSWTEGRTFGTADWRRLNELIGNRHRFIVTWRTLRSGTTKDTIWRYTH